MLNGGQPWSTHASAWYVPHAAAAAAAVAFMGGGGPNGAPSSPGSAAHTAYMLAQQQHSQLEMGDCKKG